MKTYYIALCVTCLLPMPFEDEAKRNEWAVAHESDTQHIVVTYQEERK